MNQPWNVIKASQLAGVSLDCDLATGLKIGGGTPTDNTGPINALLATASETNPIKLIIDGGTATTGIVIATAGYTEIEGIGWTSGFYIKSGSNADPINNGKILPFDPNTTPPASGEYVRLANFMINGNRGNGTTGDSNSGDPRGVTGVYWYCNINLSNLVGVRIENIYSYDSPAYSIRLDNCTDVIVRNNRIVNPNVTSTGNQDGVHIDGPAGIIRVENNYINNNLSDDAIALNANEGYAGLISTAIISNNILVNCGAGLRIDASTVDQVGTVYFTNNTGSSNTSVIGINGAAAVDSIGKIVAYGNSFIANTAFMTIGGQIGDITVTDCTWVSPIIANPFCWLLGGGTASSLTFNNCRIYRTPSGNALSPLMASSSAFTVKKMILNGYSVVDQAGQSYSAVPQVITSANLTISDLYVAGYDTTNITALADAFTGITSLHGQGVFPSSQVAAKSATYTTVPTDGMLVTTGTFSITLGTAYKGQRHTFKKADTATTLTLVGTIDGSTSNTLTTQYSKLTIEYDGTNWWTV